MSDGGYSAVDDGGPADSPLPAGYGSLEEGPPADAEAPLRLRKPRLTRRRLKPDVVPATNGNGSGAVPAQEASLPPDPALRPWTSRARAAEPPTLGEPAAAARPSGGVVAAGSAPSASGAPPADEAPAALEGRAPEARAAGPGRPGSLPSEPPPVLAAPERPGSSWRGEGAGVSPAPVREPAGRPVSAEPWTVDMDIPYEASKHRGSAQGREPFGGSLPLGGVAPSGGTVPSGVAAPLGGSVPTGGSVPMGGADPLGRVEPARRVGAPGPAGRAPGVDLRPPVRMPGPAVRYDDAEIEEGPVRGRRRPRQKVRVVRGARSRRMVRRVDVWTVLKVSFVLYLLGFVVLMVSGIVMWNVANSLGYLTTIEKSVRTLFSLKSFKFHPNATLSYYAAIAGVLCFMGVMFNVLAAVTYNLISDVVGGVQVVVVTEPD